MSVPERNKQVVRRLIADVINTGNVALLADLVSPDCVETDVKVRIVDGRLVEHSGTANMLESFLEAGPLRPAS